MMEVEGDVGESVAVVADDVLGILVADYFLLPRLLDEVDYRNLLVNRQLVVEVLCKCFLGLGVV